MSGIENKEKVWKVISKVKTAMLTTKTDSGKMHSRPMQLVQDSYDGTIWFFTGLPSDKTEDVLDNSEVCITFSGDDQYVSLYGHATIIQDKAKIDKLWSPMVSAWFPEGKDSKSCALIEINVKHGELWDSDINPISFIYELGKAKFKNERPVLGEHTKF